MKKIVLSFLMAAMLICSVGAIIACKTAEEELPLVSSVKMNITVSYSEGHTLLEWEPVLGVSYEVFRAPSRYGQYASVGKSEGTFEDEARNAYYKVFARDRDDNLIGISDPVSEEFEIFGENAYVFAPTDDASQVSQILTGIYREMESAHYTDTRYAVFFKPGDYGDLALNVPYFTTFSGLGDTPDAVTLSSLNCDGKWNGNALINFWRGVENFTFENDSRWSVSQGTFLRSVNIKGDLRLYDYDNYGPGQSGGNEASGGFLADSRISGTVFSGSQQQWFTRNSALGGWEGSVWNMVFAGVNDAPSGDRFTSVESVPVVREKPRLIYGEEGYSLAVPALKTNATGYQAAALTKIPVEDIYFANTGDSAAIINEQLESGKHIVFQPGVYRLNEPLKVENAGTVLLGMGLATLLPTQGNACVEIGDVDGVSVCGLLFDAGTKQSEVLLEVGKTGGNHSEDPTFLFDCFFRVGGNVSQSTYAETSLRINASDTVTDNIWLWRADHGSGVGWERNNGDYGAVITGDRVKSYGLFAEHYKKYNVSWSGDNGYLIFYQSELAYDVPSNEAWISEDGNGYASFRVHDNVTKFEAHGMGIYSNFQTEGIVLDAAMRVPEGKDVFISYLCGFAMSRKGTVENLINGDGLFFDTSRTFSSVRDWRK